MSLQARENDAFDFGFASDAAFLQRYYFTFPNYLRLKLVQQLERALGDSKTATDRIRDAYSVIAAIDPEATSLPTETWEKRQSVGTQRLEQYRQTAWVFGPQYSRELQEFDRNLLASLLLSETAAADEETTCRLVRHRTRHGYTSVHAAVHYEIVGVIPLLHEYGANVDESTVEGWSPIHLAALKAQIPTAQDLLNCGANVHAIFRSACYNLTPLSVTFVSASQKKWEMVKFLLSRGADPWFLDESFHRETIAHHVARNSSSALGLRILLEHDQSLVFATDTRLRTPLHVAATRGADAAIQVLVRDFGADVNATDIAGWTPLHTGWTAMAYVQRKLQAISPGLTKRADLLNGLLRSRELLVTLGADLSAKEYYGKTPSETAFLSSFIRAVALGRDTAGWRGTKLYLWENVESNCPQEWLVQP